MDFHKDFQLNGISFSNSKEIIKFHNEISTENHCFLEDWFSNTDFISVKTSGSTGKPKTIYLKKEHLQNSAFATANYFNLKAKTSALLCLSTNYIAGKMMLVRALTLGWHLDVVAPNSNPLENVNKTYNFSAMVPIQVENSLEKLNQIHKLIIGGGVVSNVLQNKLQTTKCNVFATYGMTETITHIAVKKLNKLNSNNISSAVQKSIYQILPNTNIFVDERSCLVIKAPKVSEEIIFTNDVVHLISDTQFEWLGRFDNVINSGGIKLHPEKIEEKLAEVIKSRFFVAGIPDEKLGEKLVLIVEKNATSVAVEKSLKEKIKNLETLSKFEIPKEIYFLDVFVATQTGKIQRKKTLLKITN